MDSRFDVYRSHALAYELVRKPSRSEPRQPFVQRFGPSGWLSGPRSQARQYSNTARQTASQAANLAPQLSKCRPRASPRFALNRCLLNCALGEREEEDLDMKDGSESGSINSNP